MADLLTHNQTFATPQDALAHYGKKGMKWGVRNDKKSSSGGSGKSSGKPKESDVESLKKAADEVFGKSSAAELKAEGQAKLAAQAKNGDFPNKRQEKRDAKAERLTERAGEFDKAAKDMQDAADAITPGKNPWKRYERSVYRNQAELNADQRDALLKKAEQVQAGKLTDGQKKLLIAGGIAAVAVAGTYGTHKWAEHKVGLNSAKKKELLEANKRESEQQWQQLFGEKHTFVAAANNYSVSDGSFYAGLTNKKAFSRPEFEIPEGTVFQRLSNHKEDSSEYGKIKGAYATFLSNDKKVYGASGEFGSKKYTIGFEAQGPTRVPSINTVIAHMRTIKQQETGSTPSDASLMMSYRSMAGGSWSDSTSQKLFSSLRTYGYGAIVDDMDAGYLGDLPVVFFGAAKPATSTERTTVDRLQDSASTLKLTRRHA